MATTFSASLRPTRTRILLIALTVVVLLGYGLFTAQRARSATLTKKAFAGVEVVSGTATLVHPSHVTAVVYEAMGRSEERRVGKEGRSRWSPYDVKQLSNECTSTCN